MKIKIFRRGFNYSQDGRGNRLVIHMQGCNLRCPWCSNPEGFERDGVLMNKKENPGPKNPCEEWMLEDLLKLCRNSSSLFFDGGGVTFTGGEPTFQREALMEALQALQRTGIHTAVETNGANPHLDDFFPLIDQLIMDFKTPDPVKHNAILGPGGENLTANIVKALNEHGDLHIRLPLIHGFNTSDDDIEKFLAVLGKGPKPHCTFEFLAYHEFGVIKWKQCGLDYLQEAAWVPPETIRRFNEAFCSNNLKVVHT